MNPVGSRVTLRYGDAPGRPDGAARRAAPPGILWRLSLILPARVGSCMKVGVARETAPGERRVALVPEAIARLTGAGLEVLVEAGAGSGALLPDAAYAAAGANVVATEELYGQADVILRVQKPDAAEVARLRQGQALIGLLQPLIDPATAAALAGRGVTAISLDALPRTLSRAQGMDALSSQANVGGYKAVLLAANEFGRYFPLLTTAAGTAKPANVLILGIGVAGLQAIGTARRLGAVVKAYDVRPETKEQAESLGAGFLVLKSVADASGEGGYARQLTPEEQAAQQAELNEYIGQMDVVITTAQVPGRRPPLLVTAEAVRGMKPGSVIVDMAASDLGGNCELSKAGQTIETPDGVTIVYSAAGAGDVALLFIHGGFADRSFFDGQFHAFSGRYRVIAIDLAGHA